MSSLSLLPALPNQQARQRWTNLRGCSLGLAIAEAMHEHRSAILVVCRDGLTAQQVEQDIQFFSGNNDLVMHFPDWETLPYDHFSPHQDIISDRLKTLHRLTRGEPLVLVTTVTSLIQRIAPSQYLNAHSTLLESGQLFDINSQRQHWEAAGYRCVDTVYEHGEFAVRGSVIDLFPMGSKVPYRIDLFDDELESLRSFDPETQRTLEKVERVEILPAREFPLDQEGIKRFRNNWHEMFDVDPRRCSVYKDISDGIAPAGIEYYLPLFYEETNSLLDYLPNESLLFADAALQTTVEQYWQDVNNRFNDLGIDPTRPLLAPKHLFLASDELFARFKGLSRAVFSADNDDKSQFVFPAKAGIDLSIDARAEEPLTPVIQFIESQKQRILFCAESNGRREAILELFAKANIRPKVFDTWQDFINSDTSLAITVAPLQMGVNLPSLAIQIIAEPQLFGQRVMQRRRRKRSSENTELAVKSLAELVPGKAVVHTEHGIGRYLGLESILIDGQSSEFLALQYADGAKLYVPVTSLELISLYSGGDDSAAPLHRLGTEQWSKARRKAAEKARDAAAELLDIYSRRAARPGVACEYSDLNYQQFAAGFPFEETPDQVEAIEAVLGDMRAKTPMDRLVCGDVGFGKTEVAMRAAFAAVDAGKQVALLVPTTLLAQQHYETFRDRFADWPVSVEVVSRFKSDKDIKDITQRLADGKVDILVGTHKLIQSSIVFSDLGLLIIDEEHRFGVKQKEAIKALRAEVDILTLTATPIPRTLNMAMTGMRDLSIIATPPARRLSVKTFVSEKKKPLIKEAIWRELLRGGQVYFLHNEVKTIDNAARELQELIPEARICIGHGQMRERDLEQVMSDFYHKKTNILLCTTIIETGIDVPNANTIIIDRADKFGLAQLHQLRGRVGRSHHQAYAYLLTPESKAMTDDAHKRLEAIALADTLGAGFTLASHDLEIRGAGELLGDEQSGQIQTVGLSMYMDMLDRAVKALRKGQKVDLDTALHTGPEVNLRIAALIPDEYLPDVNARLNLYKRISASKDKHQLRELQVEMIDRFGLLPDQTKALFAVSDIKLLCDEIGVTKLDIGSTGGGLEFSNHTSVDPMTIIRLLQSRAGKFRMAGATGIRFSETLPEAQDRLDFAIGILKELGAKGE